MEYVISFRTRKGRKTKTVFAPSVSEAERQGEGEVIASARKMGAGELTRAERRSVRAAKEAGEEAPAWHRLTMGPCRVTVR